jgi:hypothetical protein
MLKYKISDYYWLYAFCIIFWALLYFILKLILYKRKRLEYLSNRLTFFLFLSIAFSFLGLSTGILIGLSLSPVIGVVIPALLTFFGGFMTYIFVFGKKAIEDGYVMMTIAITLSFFLILGSDYSASMRITYERELKIYEENQKKEFEIFKSNLSKPNVEFVSPSSDKKAETQAPMDTMQKTEFIK